MELRGLPKNFQLEVADRYVIDREIGTGGMATVWLANEVRHDRPVAIKILRPDLSATLGHDRFLNEIRIAAALRHSHILTLIDSGTAGGLLFFVMPFIDGGTLRQRLEGSGALPLKEVLSLATDIGGALEHAHGRGIVHRDVKPSNILLEEGAALVTDFGIAVAVDMASSNRLTQSGGIVGTPEYMSPEQALGREVDARSDVYSLACTLFEALSGKPPFHGARRGVLLARHISGAPPELREFQPSLPRHISDVLVQALAKRPEDRFRTVTEFVTELRSRRTESGSTRWRRLKSLISTRPSSSEASPETTSTRVPRVVVLPFLDISKDGESAYLCQGIPEEIISAIWKLRGVEVVSRTSAFHFHGRGKGLKRIAKELGATHAVEGSVRAWSGEFRITVRLLDGTSGEGVAEEVFSIPKKEQQLFRAQDQIAEWVVGELGEKSDQRRERYPIHQPVWKAQLSLYRGRDAWRRRSATGFREARAAFEECLRVDPGYPEGHAAMADLYNILGAFDYAYLPPREAFPHSLYHAGKAKESGPELAEAHAALANAQLSFEWDGVAAARSLETAIELAPGYSPARQWYSTLLMIEGRDGEAEKEAYDALEFDPKSPYLWANLGRILQFRGEFVQAGEKFEMALRQSKAYLPARMGLALAQAQAGTPELALETFDTIRANAFEKGQHPPPLLEGLRGYVLGKLERTEEARRVAIDLEARYLANPGNARSDLHSSAPAKSEPAAATPYVSAEFVSGVHIGMGDLETAVQWLDLASQNRSQIIPFLGIEPMFEPLRLSPRFQALTASVRLRSR